MTVSNARSIGALLCKQAVSISTTQQLLYGAQVDPSRLYSTRPEKSVDDDLADIQLTLRELVKKNAKNVKLINYYQGMPLCFPAKLVGSDHGMLDLDIHPQQAVAIDRDRYTFLRCAAFKHDICAKIQYININKRAATLTKFFYIEIMAERRNAIRLTMNSPARATFSLNGESVSGTIADISMNGLAFRSNLMPDCVEGFETRFSFIVTDSTKNSEICLETPARLIKTVNLDGFHTHIFSIMPEKTTDQLLSRYIFQRQVEIIQELRDASS